MTGDTPRVVLATDCGSTTTKAILIQRTAAGWRLTCRGEAPTTVEAPFDDVTLGVRDAIREIEERSGRRLLADDGSLLRTATDPDHGVDLYLSTSSAGGGLQMMVAGVVQSMSVRSAERAALGAGAIVMDSVACNDGLDPHERVERIRRLRPDMILLAGGVDGGTVTHVAELAEILAAAEPRPRLGRDFRLPVVFAGNVEARAAVHAALDGKVALSVVDNLRPVLETECLGPARERIHELFMEHVMAQAPGYARLQALTDGPIVPTPGAVGDLMQQVAREDGQNIVGLDIGGATTDVFSVFDGEFHRTVSANLGMSYSGANVLAETGVDHVRRWLPVPMDADELRNRIENKTLRPTTIPCLLEDLMLEQALAREALRLAYGQHRRFATSLQGVQRSRSVGEAFATQKRSLVDDLRLGLIVGSGGVLSHAPRRVQAAWMLLDALEPCGVTRLAVDSVFMMPQLGVVARRLPQAASEVFRADCLVPLGTVVAPIGAVRPGRRLARVHVVRDGNRQRLELCAGELRRVVLAGGDSADLEVIPERRVDVGAGPGQPVRTRVTGGAAGLLLDGRGRPLRWPASLEECQEQQARWARELDAYPGPDPRS